MPHWKVILTYDGTPWHGWQAQPGLPTVQGTLAHAIHHVTGETILPQGSGRTDTGVHALGQTATFTLASPIPAANLHRALNRILPASIRILSVEEVPAAFHARHSALRKTYEYRILPNNRFCSPMRAPWLWDCRWELDFETLQQAAACVRGTHDFTSFAATDRDLATRTGETILSTEDITLSTENTIVSNEDEPGAPSMRLHRMGGTFAQRANPSTNLTPPKTASTETANAPLIGQLPAGNIRTIHHSCWRQQDDLLIYTVTGSGFLHHMVRNLVGTFVLAGSGRISANHVRTILDTRNRSAAGPTAPARGLFLVEVFY